MQAIKTVELGKRYKNITVELNNIVQNKMATRAFLKALLYLKSDTHSPPFSSRIITQNHRFFKVFL